MDIFLQKGSELQRKEVRGRTEASMRAGLEGSEGGKYSTVEYGCRSKQRQFGSK